MKYSRICLLILLTIMGLAIAQPIAIYAQAPNVVEAICNSISGFPFHGAGDFSESDNCDNFFDDVRGSYTADKLDGALFATPGQDENGDPIDISDDGTFSLSWNVDTTRGMLDDAAQSSRAECPVVDTAISSTSPGVFVHPGCVSASGYWIPVDFSYGIAAGYAESYVVTPCYDIRVEVTIYAGSPAPEDRQRSVMAEAEEFTIEASNGLINATQAACDFILRGTTSNPTQPQNPVGPTLNIQSTGAAPADVDGENQNPGSTKTIEPGKTVPITLRDGSVIRIDLKCAELISFFVTVSFSEIRVDHDISTVTAQFFIDFGLEVAAKLCPAAPGPSVSAAQVAEALKIDLQSGGINVSVEGTPLPVQVKTNVASADSFNNANFSVHHNPSSNESTVQSRQGTVFVQRSSGGGSTTLNSGQEVQVTPSGIGAPGPIGSTSPPNNSQPPDPPTISPPTGNGSDLASYDSNSSCTFEDNEFFNIVDAWISEILQDITFFMAVDYWIGQTSVCASAASIETLSLNDVAIRMSQFSGTSFSVAGQAIASSELQIYDLKGNQIHRQTSNGQKLTWNLRTSSGAVASNGVYLYRILVNDVHGATILSEVKKIVLLR